MATQGSIRNPYYLPYIFGVAWSDPTVAQDLRYFSDIEIQVDGTITGAYTPQRNFTGTAGTFYPCQVYDSYGNAVSSITTAGIYSLRGPGFFKLTGGSGATITIRAGI